MKMIIAIVQDKDRNRLAEAFVENNIQATKLSSTGGFLKAGNTTFLIGTADERVDEVIHIIKQSCKERTDYVKPSLHVDSPLEAMVDYPLAVKVGGATVFVMPVEQFMKF
ncbi:Uncharacterized protein YaaQ [Ligilactobacillus sp. WC1T17]|uniref:Uncharacterized protein YaaQ n=1 Tax=Ligilactobacillus ruminis TaxID=1623 RepID=A0ABY1AC02_9LACO|nr:Uncharacterized protein YaaQ [Ligilactobacillus ruminis]